jgi:hypothetical protein
MKFHEDKYIKVENFLSRELCKIVETCALNEERTNFNRDGTQVPDSHVGYKDSAMQGLLSLLKPKLEECTGMKLLPTYSFYRVYRPGQILTDHMDRPSCEISVTIPIGFKYENKPSDYRWSLHGYVNGEKRYIPCDIGDAVIYKGCEFKHGRDRFDVDDGSYQVQVFLHYVDANGPYKYYVNDNK